MRRVLLVSVLSFCAAATLHPLAGQKPDGPADLPSVDSREAFDPPPDFPPSPPVGDPAEALPAPSLREAFEIGAALHDPARVPDAVVSLLALMNIGVVADDAPMRAVQAPMRLRLTEAEVRRLIDMGVADANGATGVDPTADEEFTFADLYRSLAPIVRGISIEQLAQIYTEYYTAHGDSLVAKALQGQPIEPDTPLLRTQIWLMVADAVQSGQPGASWGDGTLLPDRSSLSSPDPRFSDVEWQELIVRLPLLANGRTFTLSAGSPAVHEGHGGPGTPVVFRGRVSTSPAPLVSSITGRTLLTPRTGGAGNLSARIASSGLEEHGKVSVPEGGSLPVGPDGSIQVTFTPRAERARTRTGPQVNDSDSLSMMLPADKVLNAVYAVPAAAQSLALGSLVQAASVEMSWHPAEAIEVTVHNHYYTPTLGPHNFLLPDAIPALCKTCLRLGDDWAVLTLERSEDGSYRGSGVLASRSWIQLPNVSCTPNIWVNQRATVVATPILRTDGAVAGFFGTPHQPLTFTWRRGEQAAEYLRMEFTPITKPRWFGTKDPCQDEIQMVNPPPGAAFFIPLNDAIWTVGQGSGVGLAIPERGPLHYSEKPSIWNANPADQDPIADTYSMWYVAVKRTP